MIPFVVSGMIRESHLHSTPFHATTVEDNFMFKQSALIAAFALGMATVGCDNEPTATKSDNAQERAKEASNALAESAKEATKDSSTAVKDAAESAAKKAEDVAADATKAVRDQANSLFAKAETAVKDKRWTDAEALCDQLDKLLGQLPPEWKDKLSNLRASIDAGKKGPG